MQGDSPRVAHCAHVDTDSAGVAPPRCSSLTDDGGCVPMQYIGLRARATPYQLRVAVAVQCASAGDIIRIIGHCAVSEHRRGRFAPSPRPYLYGYRHRPWLRTGYQRWALHLTCR